MHICRMHELYHVCNTTFHQCICLSLQLWCLEKVLRTLCLVLSHQWYQYLSYIHILLCILRFSQLCNFMGYMLWKLKMFELTVLNSLFNVSIIIGLMHLMECSTPFSVNLFWCMSVVSPAYPFKVVSPSTFFAVFLNARHLQGLCIVPQCIHFCMDVFL